MNGYLPASEYRKIVEAVPLLTVDIILKYQGKFLLVKRNNEPLKGYWWVIGGRVLKDEMVREAIIRKVHEEVGLTISEPKPVGFYEDTYDNSAFGVPTHTASFVFESDIENVDIKLDIQSSRWMLSDELPTRFKDKLHRFE